MAHIIGRGRYARETYPEGSAGGTGPTGPTGAAGGAMAFGSFFATAPQSATASGAPMLLPGNGPVSGIIRSGADGYVLPATGIYEVAWAASITGVSQMQLDLNGVLIVNTAMGRATDTSMISNNVLINAVAGDILRLMNPPGNTGTLVVTPVDGAMTHAQSAWLVIKQLS